MHTGERQSVAPPLRWVMWTASVFLFLIGFFHRAASGVHGGGLMPSFAAPGAAIGLLAATYFYAYAGPCAPVGRRSRAWVW